MARLILDTTVLVDAERRRRQNYDILEADDVVIAAITAAELLVGVHLADERRRPARRAFVDDVLNTIPVTDYTLAVARSHAELLAHVRRTGRRRGAHDLVVAATAKATGRSVVSADLSAFADLPGVDCRR